MNKKILILSSSPRKNGNSEILCNQFLLGAKEVGYDTEKIRFSEKKINYCTGCSSCLSKKRCSQQDDMNEILEKMISADVIVMATPVYFYTMSAQMKTLIDRTCARYSEISNKEFYFIITAAVDSKLAMERTIEGFRGFTSCLSGAKEKGIIYGTGAWKAGEIKNTKAYKDAFQMGASV
jgi:multimeric flavodoxin WrbA